MFSSTAALPLYLSFTVFLHGEEHFYSSCVTYGMWRLTQGSLGLPWTLVAAEPAAGTHTNSAIVQPDGRAPMTCSLGLTATARHKQRWHRNYKQDATSKSGDAFGGCAGNRFE